jgi:hypothetical protein
MIKISNIKREKKNLFSKKNKNDNDNFSITTVKNLSKFIIILFLHKKSFFFIINE